MTEYYHTTGSINASHDERQFRLVAWNSINSEANPAKGLPATLYVNIPLASKIKIGANDWRNIKSAKVKVGANDWRNIKTSKIKVGSNDWRNIALAPPPPLPTVEPALPVAPIRTIGDPGVTFTSSATDAVAQNWQTKGPLATDDWVNSTVTANTYTTSNIVSWHNGAKYRLRAKNYLNQYTNGVEATITANPLIVELVTNGDFANNNGTGWSFDPGATASFSNQTCIFYNNGGNYKWMKQTITGLSNGTHTFKMTRVSGSDTYTSINVGNSDGGGQYIADGTGNPGNAIPIGVFTRTFNVTSGTLYIKITQGNCPTCSSTGIFDNISLIKD